MKKWFIISILLTVPHILEDVGLFVLGRYTETPPLIVILIILGFGFMAGAVMRLSKVRRFLG